MRGDESLALLRSESHERYLACLFLPPDIREAAAVLYRFEAEIARIPGLVREPQAGEIRLLWWREVLGGSREHGGHPLARALLETIDTCALPRSALDTYLQARIFDLYSDPMPDRVALETYCGETSSALLRLLTIAAGAAGDDDRLVSDGCGHGGVALELTDILTNLPRHRARRQCFFPRDLLAASGLTTDAFVGEHPDSRHGIALAAMASLARDHYVSARECVAKLDARLQSIFMPLAVVPANIAQVLHRGEQSFATGRPIGPLRRYWLFWRASLRGLPILRR